VVLVGAAAGVLAGAILAVSLAAVYSSLSTHPSSASRPAPDPSRLRASNEEDLRARAERHDREPHSEWSDGAAASLRSSLDEVSTPGDFSVVDVDCRTTICAASLAWPTYAAARSGYQTALTLGAEQGCGKFIYVPEPRDLQKPYEATLYLDCAARTASLK
jgi:hypothetical protein